MKRRWCNFRGASASWNGTYHISHHHSSQAKRALLFWFFKWWWNSSHRRPSLKKWLLFLLIHHRLFYYKSPPYPVCRWRPFSVIVVTNDSENMRATLSVSVATTINDINNGFIRRCSYFFKFSQFLIFRSNVRGSPPLPPILQTLPGIALALRPWVDRFSKLAPKNFLEASKPRGLLNLSEQLQLKLPPPPFCSPQKKTTTTQLLLNERFLWDAKERLESFFSRYSIWRAETRFFLQ